MSWECLWFSNTTTIVCDYDTEYDLQALYIFDDNLYQRINHLTNVSNPAAMRTVSQDGIPSVNWLLSAISVAIISVNVSIYFLDLLFAMRSMTIDAMNQFQKCPTT
jgi:hypothetical protein